jgi:hypothetical protein
MQRFEVIHEDGEWVRCTVLYGLRDLQTGHLFHHAIPTKVKLSGFAKIQKAAGGLVECPDPTAKPEAPTGKLEEESEDDKPPAPTGKLEPGKKFGK